MYSITPSLYNAYYYYKTNEVSDDETPLLAALSRAPTPTTEIMQMGIDFENAVKAVAVDDIINGDTCVNEIAETCKGGTWQVKLCKELTKDIEVRGIADVITPFKIYDIKRVKQYSLGKYVNSIQHWIYMYCAEIPEFEYLISDGTTVYNEYYHLTEQNLDKLKSAVNEMIDFFLSFPRFKEPFEKNWSK